MSPAEKHSTFAYTVDQLLDDGSHWDHLVSSLNALDWIEEVALTVLAENVRTPNWTSRLRPDIRVTIAQN